MNEHLMMKRQISFAEAESTGKKRVVSTLFARADEGLGGKERSPAPSARTYMLDHPKLAPWARDEDRRLVAEVHEWLDDSLVQQWRDDAASLYRAETWRKLAEIGVLGLGVDASFGGRGHNPLSVAVLSDAFDGRVELGTMLALYVQCIVGAGWLKLCQTSPVVARLLPEIVAGKVILGTAYTDADHAAPTTITLEGDTYVLNGRKKFVVNASFAHYFLATATADGGSMTCLVDASWPGLTIVEQTGRLGARGCVQAEVIFRDVRVLASNLLARPGFQGCVAVTKEGQANARCYALLMKRASKTAGQQTVGFRPSLSSALS
jgi:alkylation response protein AidB-like acyl-CoA dehydrogenase